jgi:hypothetical protein
MPISPRAPEIGHVRSARADRSRQVDELLDGRRRPDRRARSVRTDAGQSGAAEEHGLLRIELPVREIRDDDRPAADDEDVTAVAERGDRLLLGARREDFRCAAGRHSRCCHHPTLLGRES